MDEQRAQIRITPLRYPTKPDLATGATLPGNQPEERCKLTTRSECFCIPDRRDQRGRSESADARYGRDCLTRSFLLVPTADLLFQLFDILFYPIDAL